MAGRWDIARMPATHRTTTTAAALLADYLGESATLLAYRRITTNPEDHRYAVAYRALDTALAGTVDLENFCSAPYVTAPEVLGTGTDHPALEAALERIQREATR